MLVAQKYLKDVGIFDLVEMRNFEIVWVTIPESTTYIFGILNTPTTCRTAKVFLFLMETSMSGVEAYLFHSCDAFGMNKNSFIIHVKSLLMMLQPDMAGTITLFLRKHDHSFFVSILLESSTESTLFR